MRLAYAHVPGGNLGDDLNAWLWPKLLGDIGTDADVLLGIGTILNEERGRAAAEGARSIHVFSSGSDADSKLPELDERWHLHCVRGPLTAARFGRPELAVADGAYLLRTVETPALDPQGIGFMPHHKSEAWVDWAAVCERLGWRFVSSKGDVDSRLAELASLELLVTEAMHGAIIADALRVPWIPVRFSPRFGEAKWRDFAGALGIAPTIHALPSVFERRDPWPKLLENAVKRGWRRRTGRGPAKWEKLVVTWPVAGERAIDELAVELGRLAKSVPPTLSTDAAVERVTEQLTERLALLRGDASFATPG